MMKSKMNPSMIKEMAMNFEFAYQAGFDDDELACMHFEDDDARALAEIAQEPEFEVE
ncbi:MAG: hypothetical protein GF398_08265 [Chitinivibrionales bacterium]|nr:hypothetical protein [Chitinivibrionales bacterium]